MIFSVHSHINDPEGWFLTIRKIRVFSESLCKKDGDNFPKKEVALFIDKKIADIEEVQKIFISNARE